MRTTEQLEAIFELLKKDYRELDEHIDREVASASAIRDKELAEATSKDVAARGEQAKGSLLNDAGDHIRSLFNASRKAAQRAVTEPMPLEAMSYLQALELTGIPTQGQIDAGAERYGSSAAFMSTLTGLVERANSRGRERSGDRYNAVRIGNPFSIDAHIAACDEAEQSALASLHRYDPDKYTSLGTRLGRALSEDHPLNIVESGEQLIDPMQSGVTSQSMSNTTATQGE